MSKIIKAWDSNCEGYERYERSTLESRYIEEEEEYIDPAEILAAARAEAEEKVREAYNEGFRRGTEAGLAKFEEDVGQAAQALQLAGEAMRQAREAFLDALEPQVVQLATAIAARVLQREPKRDPELVRSTVRMALSHIAERERLFLRMNPDDIRTLRKHGVTLLEEFQEAEDLDIIPDESVGHGGCMVESDTVQVDARLEAQFQRIIDALLE